MKIIFLDIDGVLNVIPTGHDEHGAKFHPHFEENLKYIIEQTGAKIVVSSSWRTCGLKEIQRMWKERGLAGEVIDATPSLYLKRGGCIVFWNDKPERHPTERIHGYSIPRGCEIEYWLENESYQIGSVKNYVILDDDTDMLMHQKEHYVRCSENTDHEDCVDNGYGLTRKNAEKAIEILNQ